MEHVQPPPTPERPAERPAERARREREAAALRENLRRRKQQSRDRDAVPPQDAEQKCP